MKLIKIQNKFILANDEEILMDDNYVAWETNYATEPKERWVVYNRVSGLNGTNQKKIISENPDLSDLKKEDCKTIGYIDVEMLADDWNYNQTKEEFGKPHYSPSRIKAFKKGFTAAQSLNDKMFSLEDIIKAFEAGKARWGTNGLIDLEPTYDEFIQSLQQTSWEVEVEMECGEEKQCECADNSQCLKPQPKTINNSIKVIKIL